MFPPIKEVVMKIEIEPCKLEAGGLYVIEVEHHLSSNARARLTEYLDTFNSVDFIILDGGVKLSRPDVKIEEKIIKQEHVIPSFYLR
jgi:hypothetical protein